MSQCGGFLNLEKSLVLIAVLVVLRVYECIAKSYLALAYFRVTPHLRTRLFESDGSADKNYHAVKLRKEEINTTTTTTITTSILRLINVKGTKVE